MSSTKSMVISCNEYPEKGKIIIPMDPEYEFNFITIKKYLHTVFKYTQLEIEGDPNMKISNKNIGNWIGCDLTGEFKIIDVPTAQEIDGRTHTS